MDYAALIRDLPCLGDLPLLKSNNRFYGDNTFYGANIFKGDTHFQHDVDTTSPILTSSYLDIDKMAAPALTSGAMIRIYAVDDGVGNTNLVGQWADGTVKTILSKLP